MPPLLPLHQDIDARVRDIRQSHPDWPCAKGCDNCCRQLAEMPRLTAAEWQLLRTGLAALPAERLREIGQAIAAIELDNPGEHAQHAGGNARPPRPVVCPLLDRASGACPVYAQRPVACRTYGFYAQRDKGLYCHDIEQRVASGALADVVWGNHDAIDRQLHQLDHGDQARPLGEWFRGWDNERESRSGTPSTPSIAPRGAQPTPKEPA